MSRQPATAAAIELADRLARAVHGHRSGHVLEGMADEYQQLRMEMADEMAAEAAAPQGEAVRLPHRSTSDTTVQCICGYFHSVALYQHYAVEHCSQLLDEWLDYFAQGDSQNFPRKHLYARTQAALASQAAPLPDGTGQQPDEVPE